MARTRTRDLEEKAKAAIAAATDSCQRVVSSARRLTQTMSNRVARARTEPFLKVEKGDFDEEDSLITSVENVIASANKKDG